MRKEVANRSKAAGLFVLLAAGAVLLAGCNSGGAGIFYTLAKATAQSAAGIGDTRSVASMTLVGTPGVYYAAAGTVYAAMPGTTPTWQAVTPPVAGDICTSLTSNGTTLYAVYYNPNADTPTSFYLYQATIAGTSVVTSPVWSTVTGFDTNSTFTVQKVYSVNGNVLVMVQLNSPPAGEGQYSLYQVTSPSSAILTGLQNPPDSGTWDGTNYWFVGGYGSPGTTGGPALYKGTTLGTLTQVASTSAPSIPTGAVYRSIYYSTTLHTIFLSTSAVSNTPGAVYASYGGGAWTANSIISWPSGTTQTGLGGFDEFLSGTTDAVLVGADTGGYYEIDLDTTGFGAATLTTLSTSPVALGQPGNTTMITAGSDYPSTTLASAHVIGFFNDIGTGSTASPERIFALTQNGLWLDQVVSGSQRSWTLQ